MKTKLILALAGLIAVPTVAGAQTINPSPSAEEARAPRPARARGISSALAVEAAQTAVATCLASGPKVTALVVDSVGSPIAMVSGDGAAVITQRIASGKAVMSVKTKMSTGDAAKKAAGDPAFMAMLVADPAMGPPRQGGLPIMIGADLVGAIAVSGAPSGAADEPCAQAGLNAISNRLASAGAQGSSVTPRTATNQAELNRVLDSAGMPGNTLPVPTTLPLTFGKDLKWTGTPGSERVNLFGDPEKPGIYGILYKWGPGNKFSTPHSHSKPRYAFVVAGTWWNGEGSDYDFNKAYPVTAGSYIVHPPGAVHWDGAKDDGGIILLVGEGPIVTTRAPCNGPNCPPPAPAQ